MTSAHRQRACLYFQVAIIQEEKVRLCVLCLSLRGFLLFAAAASFTDGVTLVPPAALHLPGVS